MNKHKFCIGIPTYNREDLLRAALAYYAIDFKGVPIFIYDNGNQNLHDLPGDSIFLNKSEKNVGVAAAWNFLCCRAFDHSDNILMLNDDIYLGRKSFEIAGLIDQYKHSLMVSPAGWCGFILSKKMYISVGPFDEVFYPAYYEDVDYERRLKLGGESIIRLPILIPKVLNVSMTLEKDPDLFFDANSNNRKRYIEKWGGDKGHEKFKVPYNSNK